MSLPYSTKGWLALGSFIVAIEACAPDGQLLSHAFDRWMQHPVGRVIATAGVVVTALHLLNATDHYGLKRADPFVLTHGLIDELKRALIRAEQLETSKGLDAGIIV